MRTLLAALLVVGACKSADRERIAEAVAKYRGFADEVCACKDPACTRGVMDRVTKWAVDMGNSASQGNEPKPNDEESKELAAIAERVESCMSRFGPPSAAPAR